MKSKCYTWFLASAILLILSGQVLARRINHDVNPANIGKLPFSATVKVKDVGTLKEFEITFKDGKGNLFHPSSPSGWLKIPNDGKPSATPTVTKVEQDANITFTFQLTAEQVEARASASWKTRKTGIGRSQQKGIVISSNSRNSKAAPSSDRLACRRTNG